MRKIQLAHGEDRRSSEWVVPLEDTSNIIDRVELHLQPTKLQQACRVADWLKVRIRFLLLSAHQR